MRVSAAESFGAVTTVATTEVAMGAAMGVATRTEGADVSSGLQSRRGVTVSVMSTRASTIGRALVVAVVCSLSGAWTMGSAARLLSSTAEAGLDFGTVMAGRGFGKEWKTLTPFPGLTLDVVHRSAGYGVHSEYIFRRCLDLLRRDGLLHRLRQINA